LCCAGCGFGHFESTSKEKAERGYVVGSVTTGFRVAMGAGGNRYARGRGDADVI
jgi:hypothetical protein